MSQADSLSRKAFHELLDLLKELDKTYLSEEWLVSSADDIGEGVRALLHMLQGGLVTYVDEDVDHPAFRKIVDTTRKYTGDNPYAFYFDAPIRAGREYRIRGNVSGAVYTSMTIEAGAVDGNVGGQIAGVINDEGFDIDVDGNFEIFLGGEARTRNWLALPDDAARITTRHYYEDEAMSAADPTLFIPLEIEALGVTQPTPAYDDASVAKAIDRVGNFLRSRTLAMKPPAERDPPDFVSRIPNQFVPPTKPGAHALAAADAAYSMAPYFLGPDEALVITARWPTCRCANVCLWNRHMQSYDYATRPTALNRAQTTLDENGQFRVIIAHSDPGLPNWIDTEGRGFGLVFWRFMLPEGEIETPQAEVVPFSQLKSG
jgi:hypothetical protein